MKISVEWLREFLDIDLDENRLCDLLTMLGLEVEDLIDPSEDLSGVYIVEVKEVKGTESGGGNCLTVWEDSIGFLKIYCTDQSVRKGDNIAIVPAGKRFKGSSVEKRLIDGVESVGVALSGRDIGLSDDGERVFRTSGFVGALKDHPSISTSVIEVAITPNRGDWVSHLGVARELSAALSIPLRFDAGLTLDGDYECKIPITIESRNDCKRYVGRKIDIKPGAFTPLWLMLRLFCCGMRSINISADVTNYVLLELGQPLHAFDLKRLKNKKILVKRAEDGEEFVALDGKTYTLSSNDLVIKDGDTTVAIAGIIGGEYSGTDFNTQQIFLESAWFLPALIRKTSKRLGIQTDSSYRFERYADIGITKRASDRVVEILKKANVLIGYSKVNDVYPVREQKKSIIFNTSEFKRLIGSSIDSSKAISILKGLGFEVRKNNSNDELLVMPPLSRPDIKKSCDIIEELARIWGYENIEEKTTPVLKDVAESDSFGIRHKRIDKIRYILADLGLLECITFSFTRSFWNTYFYLDKEAIKIKNPVTDELLYMRTSHLPQLLDVLVYNIRRDYNNIRLFEVGTLFKKNAEQTAAGLLLYGKKSYEDWQTNEVTSFDYYDLKRIVDIPWMHPGRTAVIKSINNDIIGYAGEIHVNIADYLQLKERAYYAEIYIDPFLMLLKTHTYQDISPYPDRFFDVCFVINRGVSVGEVIFALKDNFKSWLKEIVVSDIYHSKSLGPDMYSVTFAMRLTSCEKTLDKKDLERFLNELKEFMKNKFDAELRS